MPRADLAGGLRVLNAETAGDAEFGSIRVIVFLSAAFFAVSAFNFLCLIEFSYETGTGVFKIGGQARGLGRGARRF